MRTDVADPAGLAIGARGLLVHDNLIQPLPEDQVSQQSMQHKLAIWASKQ